MKSPPLIIGARDSQLALWQAHWVQSALESKHAGLKINIRTIKTRGDKMLAVPLAKVGGKGLFVKEIEAALLDGHIDLAVHSMKDMPALIPAGLRIGAIPIRGTAQDVLISRKHTPFSDLAANAKIGTSSLRRAAQLRTLKPGVDIQPLRGNIETRLKKLDRERFDAIVLAAAGVERLGLTDRISEYLSPSVMLPAAGQGALCIEIRDDDPTVETAVSLLDDSDTNVAITAERAFLNRLQGGCQTPIAAYAQLKNDQVHLTGMVASIDGHRLYRQSLEGPRQTAASLGGRLAERLLDQGAREVLESLGEPTHA